MHLGWSNLGKTIYNFYIPFCHQLPQCSWFLFGEKLTYTLAEPVSTRSTHLPLAGVYASSTVRQS